MDGDLLRIILIGIFLILSAFFSSSEAAFLSLQKTRLSYLVSNNVPGAKRISEMVNNTERLFHTLSLRWVMDDRNHTTTCDGIIGSSYRLFHGHINAKRSDGAFF